MIILYRKIVHKIMIYAYWLRNSLQGVPPEADGSNSSEIQKQWNVIFGSKNPDKKTIEIRAKVLRELMEETED